MEDALPDPRGAPRILSWDLLVASLLADPMSNPRILSWDLLVASLLADPMSNPRILGIGTASRFAPSLTSVSSLRASTPV